MDVTLVHRHSQSPVGPEQSRVHFWHGRPRAGRALPGAGRVLSRWDAGSFQSITCEADPLRRLEVDQELELRRLLDREIAGLRASEDSRQVGSGAAVEVAVVRAIGQDG